MIQPRLLPCSQSWMTFTKGTKDAQALANARAEEQEQDELNYDFAEIVLPDFSSDGDLSHMFASFRPPRLPTLREDGVLASDGDDEDTGTATTRASARKR
jgi:hypothetical protein